MVRIFSLILFFASILFLPWYISVFIGVVIIARWHAYVSAIIGGIILDSMFGAPIVALHNFAYIYTILFIILSAFAFFLRHAMME